MSLRNSWGSCIAVLACPHTLAWILTLRTCCLRPSYRSLFWSGWIWISGASDDSWSGGVSSSSGAEYWSLQQEHWPIASHQSQPTLAVNCLMCFKAARVEASQTQVTWTVPQLCQDHNISAFYCYLSTSPPSRWCLSSPPWLTLQLQ